LSDKINGIIVSYYKEDSRMSVHFPLVRAIFRPLFQAAILLSAAGLALAAPGDLDPSFGAGGKVTTTEFRPDPAASSSAAAMAIQPDGKIVVTGTTSELAGTFFRTYIILARYNPNGSLDNTFGTGGKVVSDIAGTQVEISALALQADGKILVGGATFIGAAGSNGYNFGIVRFNADGSVDTSFGMSGIATADYSGGTTNDEKIHALAVQPDGKIVAAGYARIGSPVDFAVVRFNADGMLDSTFGAGGKVSTALSGSTDVIRALQLQSDGKIIAAGYAVTASGFDFALARYNSNGTLDGNFGVNGLVFTDFGSGGEDSAYAAVLQPDGKIVAGGSGRMPGGASSDFALARYNPDGSLDSNFGAGGKATVDFFGLADRIHALVLQTNGKIAAAGYALVSASGSSYGDFALARFNPNGAIDSGFGTGGKTTTSFSNSVVEDRAFGLALQADGKLVAAGFGAIQSNTSSRLALARYLGDAPVAPSGKLFDYDGDGKADLSVFRPSAGSWFISHSSNNAFIATQFGAAGDLIAPADFDGDRKTDISVFRPSDGGWYRLNSSNNTFSAFQFGAAGDLPVPADFDGDGKADLTVYRPSAGSWYRINSSNNQFIAAQFGIAEDKPLVGDFDGDGKSDLTVYRPSNGTWYRINSGNDTFSPNQFGATGDLPVAADYDGDGKTDLAVYRPSVGDWYIINSSNSAFTATHFGVTEDKPAPADFDGDGKADLAVFRPSTGTWYLLRTTAGFTGFQFGANGDIPTPNAFVR
jgi:uncharacterized delta-60 repeat protein